MTWRTNRVGGSINDKDDLEYTILPGIAEMYSKMAEI